MGESMVSSITHHGPLYISDEMAKFTTHGMLILLARNISQSVSEKAKDEIRENIQLVRNI